MIEERPILTMHRHRLLLTMYFLYRTAQFPPRRVALTPWFLIEFAVGLRIFLLPKFIRLNMLGESIVEICAAVEKFLRLSLEIGFGVHGALTCEAGGGEGEGQQPNHHGKVEDRTG